MESKARRDPYSLVGKTLGKYRVIRLVGIGGMGAVYYARHVMTEGEVALKILKPDLAFIAPETVEYFFEEAKKTVGLNHPYIVKVTDAGVETVAGGGVENEIAYLVMEWLDGHTLEAELKEDGTMSLDRVAMLLDQICEGLAHAHARGIIHRDLKPGNIMVVPDYRNEEVVRILDFGIAKAVNSTVGVNSGLMGAPYYASPEQMSLESKIDHRSDIYSLGVMAYQLLAGQLPFDATTFEKLIHQHLMSPPPPICEVRPEIPAAVEEVVARALAKRAEDRYESVAELARAFRRATSLDTGVLDLRCVDAVTGESVANASVYLDGKYAGDTDQEGHYRKSMVPKEYEVEVESHPYLALRERVLISPRAETALTAKVYPKEVGDLIVNAGVSGAGVFIDRKPMGKTGETGTLHLRDLPPGRVLVEIKNPRGTYTYAAQVEIVKWQQSTLDVELPADSGRRSYLEAAFGSGRTVRIVLGAVAITVALTAVILTATALVRKWRGQPQKVTAPPSPTPQPRPSQQPTPADTPTPPAQPYRELAALPIESNDYYQVVLSPDGRLAASVGDKNAARLWSIDGGRGLPELEGAVTGGSVGVSPGGDVVAAGGDDRAIRLWRAGDGVLLNTLRGHTDSIFFVGFSPDGQTLVSASQDGVVKMWRVGDGSLLRTLLRPVGGDHIISISRDQTAAALWSESDQGVLLWSLGEYRPLKRLEGSQSDWTSGAFSDDGALLAVAGGDGIVHIWRVSDGSLANTLRPDGGGVLNVAFSPDGMTIAAGMKDGTIHLLGVNGDAPPVVLKGHAGPVYSLSFSADGRVLASEADDKSIRLWNVKPTER